MASDGMAIWSVRSFLDIARKRFSRYCKRSLLSGIGAASTISACTFIPDHIAYYDLPISKQKQRIHLLEKKLEFAEKSCRQAQEDLEMLKQQLADAHLTMIRRQLDLFDETKKSQPPLRDTASSTELFLKERESLQKIIEQGMLSFEARVLLDRIQQEMAFIEDVSYGL